MDGWITIGTKLDTKTFDKQILELERKANDIEDMLEDPKKFGLSTRDVAELEVELEKTKNKLVQLNKEKDKVGETAGVNNLGRSFSDSIKHAARLTLAIFGIRTAYNLLRQASSELASYDQQYATNLEYIRYVLVQAIAPILRYIVGLAMQLLSYINAIANGWFGINLFGNASAKSFQKMKAGAGGVSKAVKEIKKELSGFDEINMLSDQSDSGAGGGGGTGGAMPDFDLSSLAGEVPDWLQFIIDHRNEILAIMAGIAAGLLAWRLGLDGIKALGIGIMIAGVVYAIMSLIDYLNDPSWTNFGKIIQGIGVAIIGLGVIIESVPVAVAGAVVLIVGIIIKYWEQIRSFLQSGIDWLIEKSGWVHEKLGNIIGTIYDSFVHTLQSILNWFNTLFTSIKNIFDGIIKVLKGAFTGNWKLAWEGIKQIAVNAVELIKRTFLLACNVLGDIANSVGAVIRGIFKGIVNSILAMIQGAVNLAIGGINKLIGAINIIPGVNIGRLPSVSLPRLKVGGIINMPNKGTMVGSAIAGESGREGVVPLTDSQAMSELGREIGKNVIVNITNVTTMNGRVINRQLRQTRSNQEFAYNT